jgi:hypothetical protein
MLSISLSQSFETLILFRPGEILKSLRKSITLVFSTWYFGLSNLLHSVSSISTIHLVAFLAKSFSEYPTCGIASLVPKQSNKSAF